MKKYAILTLAALLAVVFVAPAFALENQFGGYWRTRFIYQNEFDADDDNDDNNKFVDTRTRLYYTAKINDNLKLVNRFEMDARWGNFAGGADYGDVGADGIAVEVKHSHAIFNIGNLETRVGVQGYYLLGGNIVDNDASGIVAIYKAADWLYLGASWLKSWEGNNTGAVTGNNNEDADSYTFTPTVFLSKEIKLQPSVTYLYSSNASNAFGAGLGAANGLATPFVDDIGAWVLGLDARATYENFGLFFMGGYQTGYVHQAQVTGNEDLDLQGWFVNVGGNVGLGPVDLRAEAAYYSGDDDIVDDDAEMWVVTNLTSHYWSELLGYGIFDNTSPMEQFWGLADRPTNVWWGNVGVTIKPMAKLKVAVDLWYAEFVEEEQYGLDDADLGLEADVVVTYQLVEGLNLDLVGAYLWAGDALTDGIDDDADPFELGARLSLSF
jgi:hypothetical protein